MKDFLCSLAGTFLGVLMLLACVVYAVRMLWLLWNAVLGRIVYFNPAFPWRGAIVARPKRRRTKTLPTRRRGRPSWLRFLLEETPASLLERYRRRKWARSRNY